MYQYDNVLNSEKRFHFVGIGGSGMCPIAEILHAKGYTVTGSDISEGDTLTRIKNAGIPVSLGHHPDNLGDAQVVVYTAACKPDNPELVAAAEKGLIIIERCVMLGIVGRRFPHSIAVSGTHGKTTTTSMITQVLTEADKDPTAVIGGKLSFIGSNARIGKSKLFVCEACEYVDTFLKLTPYLSIILNVDEDHLDYFKNMERIIESFHSFADITTDVIVVNGDDENSMKSIEGLQKKIITFGENEGNTFCFRNLDFSDRYPAFDIYKDGVFFVHVKMRVPGRHNVMNALAAVATCDHFDVPAEVIAESLGHFTGADRRFQFTGSPNGITLIDDFAHHPTELAATLSSINDMDFNNVWVVFQPHTFSRTFLLMDQFAKVLRAANHLLLTEILAVRETNTYGVSTSDLAVKIPGSMCFKSFEEIADFIRKNARPGDAVLTMGGGDIYKCNRLILQELQL